MQGVNSKTVVLIVDDDPGNLLILSGMLRPDYEVLAATSGEKALRIAAHPKPDLILLDVMMPGMNGYQVFERLRADPDTSGIPVIFITSMDSTDAQLKGLELGAVDYITKPINPRVVMARIRNQLELKQARDRLAMQNDWLGAEVSRRMAENDLIQLVSIRALAHLAETRDPETGNHILRTQGYVHELAVRLQDHPRFATTLNDRYIDLLTRSAPLHDIGKVGIPDAILLKPGPLTAEEWVVMRTHTKLGSDAIERTEVDVTDKVEFLALAKEIAHWHHERWDGGGYPDGLAGDAIPVSARIMAVADVFDAIISPRVYKAPMSHDHAREIIANERTRQFDPDITDAFLDAFATMSDIARCYRDGAAPTSSATWGLPPCHTPFVPA